MRYAVDMAGSQLSDEDLRDAAAEAGLSPQEVRMALAERNATATSPASRSPVGIPARGVSVRHVEGHLALRPGQAVAELRRSIERQTGKSGHKQGEDQADIVDEERGLTYRIRARDDGAAGALVRVDIDPSQGHGGQALATTGIIGVTASIVALGWLFGAMTLWLGGLGFGVLGGLLLVRNAIRLRQATAGAQGIAAHALLETEERVSS